MGVWDKIVRVPSPADFGLDGASVVTLVLRSRTRGLRELYSIPRSAAFLHADIEFQEALERAWTYGRRWHDGCTDVRWMVGYPSLHLLEVGGASVSAGFGLGLMHLVETGYKPTTVALKLAVLRRLYEAIQWHGHSSGA